MPSNSYKSPFASAFKSAMKRGVPCSDAVCNIAKKNNKTTNAVFTSLWKAGLCWRQKFNGTWIYCPCENGKGKATNWKNCQVNMWQCFVDWCICSGTCTPDQMKKCMSSQSEFMKACRKWWNAQFKSTTTNSKTTSKRSRPKTTSRKRTTTTTTKARKTTASKPKARKTTAKSNMKKSTVSKKQNATKSNKSRKNTTARSRSTATNRKSRTTSVSASSRRTKGSAMKRRSTARRAA